MGELKDKMRRDLELRGYRPSTLRIYLSEAERFAAYFMRSPREMGEEHIKRYLLFRKQSGGLSTLKISVAALKFLYIHTLDRPEQVVRIPWPRTPKRLPDILSGSEVSRLLEAIDSLKHRMIIMTAYSTGARISEVCSLKVKDIDSKRMLIHIRDGKRARDRYVMLSERFLLYLRQYWKTQRPRGQWLFPGREANSRIGTEAVREALHKAAQQSGIDKRITPHILRHSFATHLLESGSDIRTIQALLGHSSIRTTERYVKVSTKHVARVKSPFDLLGTEAGAVLG